MHRRPLRFQYPGAVYHVMARGDGGDAVFETDDDRKAFLSRLGEVCGSHGWRIHVWLLMSNHFHLLLETPAGEWGDGDEVFAWCLQPRLEARAANDGGAIDAEATKSLKRGWYLGKESFKDRLLKLLEKPVARAEGGSAARGEGPVRDRGRRRPGDCWPRVRGNSDCRSTEADWRSCGRAIRERSAWRYCCGLTPRSRTSGSRISWRWDIQEA
jgi:hypothetical protein